MTKSKTKADDLVALNDLLRTAKVQTALLADNTDDRIVLSIVGPQPRPKQMNQLREMLIDHLGETKARRVMMTTMPQLDQH